MTARMKLPDIEEQDKPKRRPIPDHIPRMEVELTPGANACADCGGRLRRIGEDGEPCAPLVQAQWRAKSWNTSPAASS